MIYNHGTLQNKKEKSNYFYTQSAFYYVFFLLLTFQINDSISRLPL